MGDAKAKEGSGSMSALKEVEKLAPKVGAAKDVLKLAESEVKQTKALKAEAGKKFSAADSALNSAIKADESAKIKVEKAKARLAESSKKLAEKQKKDAKKKAI